MAVGNETYKGTLEFRSLFVDKNTKNYSSDNFNRYKELLHETSALHQEYDPLSRYPWASRSDKWKKILAPIWKAFQENGAVQDPGTATGEGVKMYLRKNGKCYNLKKPIDGGMHISPRPKLTGVYADGLDLRRRGSGVLCGEGLILGKTFLSKTFHY